MAASALRFTVITLALVAWPSRARADVQAAVEALTHGEYAVAEPLLRAARGPDRAAADRLLGRLLMETGRYDDARRLGEQMARGPVTHVDGLTLEGEALEATGQYEQALARWNQAIGRGQVGVARRARAHAGVLLARIGRRQDAQDLAQPLIDEYNDAQQEAEDHPDTPGHVRPSILHDAEALTYLGMAMRTLGFFQDANQAFDEATRADAHRVETLLESSELYLSKEDMGHSGDALRDAFTVNPHDARALVLRARTRLMNDLDFTHALEDLAAADAINPHASESFALHASIVLRDSDVAGADRWVDQALAVNPHALDALAMRAVIRFDANDMDGFRRALDAVFAVSPVYVDAYALLGEFADWEHRYDEAIAIMRDGLSRPAIAADPRLQGQLRAQLGINLLRTGAEEDGLRELRESFRRDRYNVRVYNLLNLYDDTIVHEYTSEPSGPFVIRYQNDERPVLTRYVPQLLTRAYRDMVARYHFTPAGPITIEMYANTEQFSVRTAGLPEIGVQGVCFGKVITAISPAGGPFNWGQILWHELAHVFAIQLSHSRVPRWFTEGLSEWEAFHSHPEWAREDDPSLYRAMIADRVPHVVDFNTAFTHARSGGDMMVAYYAASKLVEYLIDHYGFDRVIGMLPMWGHGAATPDVLRQGLGIDPAALDRDFRVFTLQRLARYRDQFAVDPGDYADREALSRAATQSPNDANALARSAVAEMAAGETSTAEQRANAALHIDATQPIAHWVLAGLALHAHDGATALRHVDAIIAAHHDGFELRALEARAARAAHDDTRLRAALEAATRLDPTQADAWESLVELHHAAHRTPEELAAVRQLVRLDQHNRPALRRLFAILAEQSGWAEIAALMEQARNLDPEEAETHSTLARALAATNHRDDAIYEYESALVTHPHDVAAVQVALGTLYLSAGRRAQAVVAVRAALAAAPANTDARALAQQLGVH